MFGIPLYIAIPLGILAAISAVYILVRVGSIAHFRTKSEYDRQSKRRI